MTQQLPTQLDWVIRFRAGDGDVFRVLWVQHSARLRTYCTRFAPDADALDDLIQDTWIRVFDKRELYRGGRFENWLLKVARTVCLRSTEKLKFLPMEVTDGLWRSPSEEAETVARNAWHDEQVTRVLRLPLKQRQTLLLRHCAGLSTRETAEKLHCSQGTIKATLHQAIRKLRGEPQHGPSMSC